ncbi:hypothetical protein B5K05_08580 [Rhizobium phaseoli]|nr:hypothetical protein B5K05_08580 [Rhizobium phaseoli]
MRMSVRMLTPLCPAGHLPYKGGDRLGAPGIPFSPAGRRWPEGADEGGGTADAILHHAKTIALRLRFERSSRLLLAPLIRPDGHLLAAGEKRKAAPDHPGGHA